MNNDFLNHYLKMKHPIYNKTSLILANEKPIIRHLFGKLSIKPQLFKGYDELKKEWNYFAKKTEFYSAICLFFKNILIKM